MDGKITYHQQVTYCGKPRCRKCREGVGHGPYWYAYTTIDGHTTRKYIGKKLPSEAEATLQSSVAVPANPIPIATSVTSSPLARIFTLGQYRLERYQYPTSSDTIKNANSASWQVVRDTVWQQRQDNSARALLSLLICSPERRVGRSQAITLLWPGLAVDTAMRRFNKTVQQLQKLLSGSSVSPVAQTASLLQVDGEWITLAGQAQIWLDTDEFEAYVKQATTEKESTSLELQREQVLRSALDLYTGDFLPEEGSADWIVTRRQTLHREWSTLSLNLADALVTRQAFAESIDILNRILSKDTMNEAAVQRLMLVLAHLKRRVEALQVYQRFASVLQREYQAVPSDDTQTLYEAVRRGSELPAHPNQAKPASLPAHESTPSDLPAPIDLSWLSREPAAETIGRLHQNPLVGRDAELEDLRVMLLQVEQCKQLQLVGQRKASGIPLDTQRRPQCLLLMGDAGIGKTRLAEEVGREARKRGWSVFLSRLYPQESGVPYRVWTEALGRAIRLHPHILTTLEIEQLQILTSLLPELQQMLPERLQEPSHFLSPDQEQLRLWDAIGELFKTLSEQTPLLIMLDDIQWADDSSHKLLGHLIRLLYGYPIMFVVTCRDSELPRRPLHLLLKLVNHMQRERSIKILKVEPLTPEQIGALVTNVSQLPEATIKHIQDQAAGNPFFAEELARSTPPLLPQTVVAALDHRFGRLSIPCQQLLKNAAVLGGTFEFSLICAMEAGTGEREGSGSNSHIESSDFNDEDTVLTLLEEALQAGVLTDEGSGTRIFYHFWHPLLVSRLYELLSGVRRARLHQRAADVLIRLNRGHEDEVAAIITDHLLKAGADAERIARFAEIAGDRAYAVFAYPEAKQRYLLAVEQLRLAGADSDTSGQSHLALLLERLADCLRILGPFSEARRYYENVLTLRSQIYARDGNDEANEQQRLHEIQIQALLQLEIGWTWSYTADKSMAWQCCHRAQQVLQEANVKGGPAWARLYHLQGLLYQAEGRYEEALQCIEDAIALFEQQLQQRSMARSTPFQKHATRIQRMLIGDPVSLGSAHRHLAMIAQPLGQLSKVLEHQSKALALYEQYNEQRQIAHISCDMGYTHLKKGEYELARAALLRSRNLAERVGDYPILSVIYNNLGELAAVNGDFVQAEEYCQQALEGAEEIIDRRYMTEWNAGLASIFLVQGKIEQASARVVQALRIGRSIHHQIGIAQALVALGNIRIAQAIGLEKSTNRSLPQKLLTTDNPRLGIKVVGRYWSAAHLLLLAQKDLERALKLAQREIETRTRAYLALAHVAFLLGKREEARVQIQQVIVDGQRYELAQVVARARQLLEQVNG